MQSFSIASNDALQRLDKFLKKLLPQASLSLIYKLNRTNKVKVNKKRVPNDYKLQAGETVELFLRDEDFAKLSQIASVPLLPADQQLQKQDIIYEDAALLIVNKPAGLNVHPGDFKTSEISLIQMVQDYLGNKLSSLTFKPSLVHRIDRDTSGIVLIAKTKPSLSHMLAQLQNNKIQKTYTAICVGRLAQKTGTITAKLHRTENAQNANKVQVDEKNGQTAITHYTVLAENIHNKYSLVECTIETGRMHQIRVHFAHIGNPILGDNTYGNKAENAFAERNFGIWRQMLHASQISFLHPVKNIMVRHKARLKDDMQKFLPDIL